MANWINYETPAMKIPVPTAADDGKVLGFSSTTGLGWVVGGATGPAGTSGYSGYSGTSGFSGI